LLSSIAALKWLAAGLKSKKSSTVSKDKVEWWQLYVHVYTASKYIPYFFWYIQCCYPIRCMSNSRNHEGYTVNSQIFQAVTSWAACSNANNHVIDGLIGHGCWHWECVCIFGVAIFCQVHLTIRRTLLLSTSFLLVVL
jgi:hypothetical protein